MATFVVLPPSTMAVNTPPSLFAESALKIPIRPVYALTSTYRI
jgi:hypothetical protein